MTYVNKNGGENMPRGDHTGPKGRGAMTGRKRGICGSKLPESEKGTNKLSGMHRRGTYLDNEERLHEHHEYHGHDHNHEDSDK